MVMIPSLQDSLTELTIFVEVDTLKESEISVQDGADQLDVSPEALRAFALEKNVLQEDYLPIAAFQRFSAAMFMWRKNYYDEKTAIAKIGNREELNRLVNTGKIRVKFYHTLLFYHREDVDAACKPAIVVDAQQEKPAIVPPRAVTFVPVKETRNPVATDKGAKVTGTKFFIDGEEYVSISEAARILKEKMGTVWQWIYTYNFLPFITVEEDWVKRADVQAKLETPFFQQERYSYTAVGNIYEVTRFTVAKWVRDDGVAYTTGPGGQRYILADQLPRCVELAERAHKFSHHKE